MAGRFGSVVTAMVTPFREDHAVDLDGAQELAAYLLDHGSDALVVAGSTGEAPTLTHKEKRELFRAVGEAVRGRGQLICGTGTYATAETLELTQAAEDAGADGLLVVTPYYNKPPQRGLVAHFERIADATDLPIIAYNIPGRTATRIEHDTLLALAAEAQHRGREGLHRRLPGDLAPHRRRRPTSRSTPATTGPRSATSCLGAVGVVVGRRASRGAADPPDDRADRDRRRRRPPARSTRRSQPAVQRAVHHDQPDPAEGSPRARRPAGRRPAPAARARHRRGARPGPEGVGGRRSPLTLAAASSSSAGSARSAATWPASSSTAAS